MKKLILLLILLLSMSFSYSQNTRQVSIEPILEPFVQNFIEEAVSRGHYDVMDRILDLDSIVLVQNKSYLEFSTPKKVELNAFVVNDVLMTKVILFHGLFHSLYDIDHCHPIGMDLMCEYKPDGFTFTYFSDPELWQKELDKTFGLIK